MKALSLKARFTVMRFVLASWSPKRLDVPSCGLTLVERAILVVRSCILRLTRLAIAVLKAPRRAGDEPVAVSMFLRFFCMLYGHAKGDKLCQGTLFP